MEIVNSVYPAGVERNWKIKVLNIWHDIPVDQNLQINKDRFRGCSDALGKYGPELNHNWIYYHYLTTMEVKKCVQALLENALEIDAVSDGDHVAITWIMTATNLYNIGEISPTNKSIKFLELRFIISKTVKFVAIARYFTEQL